MLGDEADGLGEDADRLLLGLVFAATVRGLDDHVVRVGEDGGIADDRGVAPAEVAGEDDRPLRGDRTRALAVLDAEPDDRRAQDVAGIEERREHPGRHLALLVVGDRAEPIERSLGVAHGVEGLVKVDLERRRLPAERLLGRRGRPGHPRLDVLAPLGHGSLLDDGRLVRHDQGWAHHDVDVAHDRARAARVVGGTAAGPGAGPGPGVGLGVVVGRVVGHGALGLGLGDRGFERGSLLDLLGRRFVGMARLPAAAALRELLLELARVQEHEPSELLRGRRSRRSGPGSPRGRPAGAGRSGRGARA